MKKKVYIAGSLFSESEIAQRVKEETLLVSQGYEVFNPITAPCNDKSKMPTAKDIFWGDTKEIMSSDIVVADISNPLDCGVQNELGMVWAFNQIHRMSEDGLTLDEILKLIPNKKLIAHLSDIRKSTAHNYKGNYIPVGFNQFEIGMIEDTGVIKDNFQQVLDELKVVKPTVCKTCCDNCMGTQISVISGDYNCRTYAESKKKKGN